MAGFSGDDRRMIGVEETLWVVVTILETCQEAGAWNDAVKDLLTRTQAIAREMRDYLDKLEED
jgi:hypothetical protein